MRLVDKHYALAGEAARSAVRFLIGIALARWANADAYAAFVLMLSIEVVFHTALASYFVTPLVTLLPRVPREERGSVIRRILRRHLRWALSGTVVGLAASSFLRNLGAEWVDVLAFAAAIPLAAQQNAMRAAHLARFRASHAVLGDIPATVAPLIVVGIAAYNGASVLQAYWITRAFGALTSMRILLIDIPKGTEHPAEHDAALSKLGRPMLAGSIAATLCTRTQPFVLAAVATTTQIAQFGVASALVGPLRLTSATVAALLRPRLALHVGRRDRRGIERSLKVALGMVLVATAPCVMAAVIAGDEILEVVFGPNFANTGALLVWATLAAALACANSLAVVVLQVCDAAEQAAKLRFLACGVSCCLVAPLSLQMGASGAFCSLLSAEVVYLIGAVRGIQRALTEGTPGPVRAEPSIP